ncbi:MAG TPA: TIM barrel protein [Candidatus Nanoarchaeia archaeon]|nr:TIM barrel protein [Candidatus Nanoarchaeia archaeon]
MIRFGPAGLGGAKEAVHNLEEYHKKGISACEIAFTYGIYLMEADAIEIGRAAKSLDIRLSIHAPYWINLNSAERRKVEESRKRILDCCKIGNALGAYLVVFHPGYYGKMEKEETYQNIKREIIEIVKEIKKNGWKITIAAETTGKANVFGSVDDILRLVNETGCSFCIDFAHIRAREKIIDYKGILEKFKNHGSIHIHFSGIEYGEKGEKRHILTPESEIKELLKNLHENIPKSKEIVVINESPSPVEDSVKAIRILKKIL